MPKVLITGSNGMLGSDLVKVYQKSLYEVSSCDNKDFDIADKDAVLSYIEEDRPDCIIHPAAWTDVDGCEFDRDKAYRVNALGTRNVAIACNQLNIPLVYYSTDYVFNGNNKEGYREDESTSPINYYGRSKLEGENFVKSLMNKFYIIRISWLYGRNGKNFVNTIIRLAEEKGELTVVNDQTGSPTYTMDVAKATLELIKRPAYGTYHITNTGSCTWFEFAKTICEYTGKTVKISPVSSQQYKRPAARPAYSILDNYHWRLEGNEPLRHYREALKEYLSLL